MIRLALAALLGLTLAGCVEESDPALSRIGRDDYGEEGKERGAVIRLTDGQEIRCDLALEIDTGWECHPDEDSTSFGHSYYAGEHVLSVAVDESP